MDPDDVHEQVDLNQDGSIAVIDTGTSMLAVPHEDYDMLTSIWEHEINNPNEFIC